ncbi:uncharacterized protein Eint_111570 [Encephalitozoon intestinalis ATCC 50506]|uniref:Uncharacterized protein n=1 Tax=Encephalitozoon intestinalis (strain ATCC 50506) TaxID=876142 RepID=E0SA34_ENCIT|nr:uncharacterized protein Eint_111570 [Encephalitozoon intestinalis ATCC 50506]ADM12656.2 hypothetical protein Eint_111570 [Encephalitozoon intestinalis ATCC 50506]UTX46516.1 PC4 and SFRS1-interacting protein-like protein [Encephalitozoon intestinalis]
MMLYRVMDLIVREDTFKLFTSRTGNGIFERLEEAPRMETVEDLEERIKGYFQEILKAAPADSLYFNEAFRMFNFVERIFKELRDLNESAMERSIRSPMDDVIRLYSESLGKFIEDMDIPILQEHVRFIIS